MTPLPSQHPALPGLPTELSSFVGRHRELGEVEALLGESRLLTLTGAGGSGKSRLALEVVGRVAARFPDGVMWVELSSLSDPSLLPLHVAAALEVRDHPGSPAEAALRAALEGRSALLVLDSCEHLVEACARLATDLLRACPTLRILATSREALGVPGERAWLVPPLTLPGPGTADPAASEAVQLFVERARSALPAFELTPANREAVAQVCARLDGIPLAIELAAARIRVLPPEQIADRLDDAFRLLTAGSRTALPRHKTLRETIDWSYALLTPREQLLLQRIAVFGGSFTLEAVEQVGGDDRLPAGEILDVLAALVDKSMVTLEARQDGARYTLLGTVRQYALEKLRETDGMDPWRERQALWAVELAEAAAPHIFGGASHPGWLDRLDAEADNMRAAAIWAEEDQARAELALRLCAALHWYWYARGRFREGRQRLDRALAQAGAVPPLVRARGLIAFGHVGLWQGEAGGMVAPLREAVALMEGRAEPADRAYALASLGAGLCMSGDLAGARQALEASLALADPRRKDVLSCFTRYWAGITVLAEGDVPRALRVLEEGLEVAWQLGNKPSIGHILTILGRAHWSRGDLDHALAAYREALAVHGETGDAWGLVQATEGIARIRLARGDSARGICLISAAAAWRERLAVPMVSLEQAEIDGALAEGRRELSPEAFAAAWDKGQRLPQGDLVAMGLEADITDAPLSITAELPIPVVPMAERPTLEVRALGGLDVVVNGTPVAPDGWGSARARELLLLMLVRRQGLTKEEVGLIFWPDASPAQVRNSFHVTLHRLRRALDHAEWVVSEGDRYRIRPGLATRFDADQFEKAILLGLRAAERRAGDAAEQLREALSLYRGPFLQGESVGDWHLDTRDRLQVLAARGALGLGRLLEAGKDWAGAAEAYRRLVEWDDLHEEGVRALMIALARQGERTQALRLYGRLVERLARELSIEPEDETVATFEQLQRGELP